jgi:hypothetical protein
MHCMMHAFINVAIVIWYIFFRTITERSFKYIIFSCWGVAPPTALVMNIKYTVENTEGAIKNGQSRETGMLGYTIQTKTQHNMCCTPIYANHLSKLPVRK